MGWMRKNIFLDFYEVFISRRFFQIFNIKIIAIKSDTLKIILFT